MQNAKLNNFDPHARVAIRVFEDWQMKIFKKMQRKGGDSLIPINLINLHRAVQEKHGERHMKAKTQ